MADTRIADEFNFPIKDGTAASCLQCHKDAESGTWPIGKLNRSWHPGLHFSTDKPIVAIADGEVVAYRFSQKSFEDPSCKKMYSDSFVLIRHLYKSVLGNVLDFYSLYMHLDPVPFGDVYRYF